MQIQTAVAGGIIPSGSVPYSLLSGALKAVAAEAPQHRDGVAVRVLKQNPLLFHFPVIECC
ncbi:MAG: hypothetical protein WBQ23_14975 [Bacteroidota bacterium]